jgi:hypothetical protein
MGDLLRNGKRIPLYHSPSRHHRRQRDDGNRQTWKGRWRRNRNTRNWWYGEPIGSSRCAPPTNPPYSTYKSGFGAAVVSGLGVSAARTAGCGQRRAFLLAAAFVAYWGAELDGACCAAEGLAWVAWVGWLVGCIRGGSKVVNVGVMRRDE